MLGMDAIDNLLSRIERHRKRTGQSKSAFGVAVLRNPSLIGRIESRRVSYQTIDTVSSYLTAHESQRAAAKKSAKRRGRLSPITPRPPGGHSPRSPGTPLSLQNKEGKR